MWMIIETMERPKFGTCAARANFRHLSALFDKPLGKEL
jgi:hypothetical protein